MFFAGGLGSLHTAGTDGFIVVNERSRRRQLCNETVAFERHRRLVGAGWYLLSYDPMFSHYSFAVAVDVVVMQRMLLGLRSPRPMVSSVRRGAS